MKITRKKNKINLLYTYIEEYYKIENEMKENGMKNGNDYLKTCSLYMSLQMFFKTAYQ